MEPSRPFLPEQIQVPPELPGVLKELTKAVLRERPSDVLAFALEFFQAAVQQRAAQGGGSDAAAAASASAALRK